MTPIDYTLISRKFTCKEFIVRTCDITMSRSTLIIEASLVVKIIVINDTRKTVV